MGRVTSQEKHEKPVIGRKSIVIAFLHFVAQGSLYFSNFFTLILAGIFDQDFWIPLMKLYFFLAETILAAL